MSHFTVLVAVPKGKTAEEQLAPYQENNMGDCPQKYLKWRVWDKDGEGHWFDSREHFLVSGIESDGDEGYWENPNKKWDWYQTGGRWTGLFRLKVMSEKNGELIYARGESGPPGLMTEPNEDDAHADVARAGDIDWEWMIQQQKDNARTRWRDVQEMLAMRRDGKDTKDFVWDKGLFLDDDDPVFSMNEFEYVEHEGLDALTWAVVDLEGNWIERAEMGWWGLHSDKNEGYGQKWWEFVRGLPEDVMVYNVDCHI